MTSHFRELHRLYADCLGIEDVDGAFSVNDAKAVKRIFARNAMLAMSPTAGTLTATTQSYTGFKPAHELDALRRVCNALLAWKREQRRSGAAGGEDVVADEQKTVATTEEDSDEDDDDDSVAVGVASTETLQQAQLACVDELRDESETRLSWKFLVPFVGDAAAVAVMESTLVRAVVDYHYATARPQMFDMFVHLSATEMFFVDGDALLMAALSSPHVDWDCMQPLHILHNAQQLLRRLHVRGARFHVIFFDDAAWVWSHAPQKRFIREELRLTLMAAAAAPPPQQQQQAHPVSAINATATPLCVFTFPSFHSEAFVRHLAHYSPEFMLVSDGEQLGTPTPLHRLFLNPSSSRRRVTRMAEREQQTQRGAETETAVVDAEGGAVGAYTIQRPYRSIVDDVALGDKAAFYFRCMHIWLAARRVTVAYASRIIAKENAMIVFAVTTDSDRTARAMIVEERVTALAAGLACGHDNDGGGGGGHTGHGGTSACAAATLSQASLALANDEEVSLREQIVNAAVHAYLSTRNGDGSARSPQQRQLCVVLVAAAYCAPLLTAAERAQPAAECPVLVTFLNEMTCYMLPALRHCGVEAGRGDEYDVYDGHLLAALVHLLRTTALAQLLDEDGVYDVNYTWNNIVRALPSTMATRRDEDDGGGTGPTASGGDADDEDVTQKPLTELPVVLFAHPPPRVTYHRVAHDLVDRLARTFAVRDGVGDGKAAPVRNADEQTTATPTTTTTTTTTTTAAAAAATTAVTGRGDGTSSSRVPYPSGFGEANKLSGWVVSRPFDALNDVVDSYVEAEKRRRMTAREQRQAEKMEVNYMQDAKEQAESMGLRGFTTETLLCVRSDSDADDDDDDDDSDDDHATARHGGGSGGRNNNNVADGDVGDANSHDNNDDNGATTERVSGADVVKSSTTTTTMTGTTMPATAVGGNARVSKNVKKTAAAAAAAAAGRKAHAGQRNKKTRSKEEVIREEANLRDAYVRAHEMLSSVTAALRDTDYLTITNVSADERAGHVERLSAALSKMTQSNLARKFEASENAINDAVGVAAADGSGNGNNKGTNATDASRTMQTSTPSLRVTVWRALVDASGLREAEFAMTLDEPKPSLTATSGASAKRGGGARVAQSSQLYGVALARKLVARHMGGGSSSGSTDNASRQASTPNTNAVTTPMTSVFERLCAAKPRGPTADDVTSYLVAVYLAYVQLHLQLRLMSRIAKLHLDTWRGERERARVASEQPDIKPGVTLFMYCHYHILALVRDYGVAMATDDLDLVRSALAHFDFAGAYYDKVDRAIAQWQGRPLSALPPSLRPQHRVCEHTPERMQLLHMGHLLERPVIAARDARVVFNPDEWQRELLDIVDRRGSAVVCAPTSAGKTFISYYCMYNALRTSNRKVVVYVAPIRALINQAVVDVLARYGSKTYTSSGKNVCGVHGGDNYHRYLRNCQVLVTLPEVLEKILLSPLYKDWAANLDYAILDEIHTMESSGNGDVWQRVLALLPCPYIALSATLGETRELCAWLNRAQDCLRQQQGGGGGMSAKSTRRREYTVHEIPRPGSGGIQRWNDIKKYIYMPPLAYNPPLKKLTQPYEARYVTDLHPLSVLTLEQLQRGFPPDITLVPSEVLQLYTRMCDGFRTTVWPRWSHVSIVQAMHAQLDDLVPEHYFAHVNYITQQHARAYEGDVKNAFVYWVYLGQQGSTADGLDTLDAPTAAQLRADVSTISRGVLASFAAHLLDEEQALGRAAAHNTRTLFDRTDGADVGTATALATPDAGGMDAAAAAAAGTNATPEHDDTSSSLSTDNKTDNDNIAEGDHSDSGRVVKEGDGAIYFPDSKQFVQANILHVLRELRSRDMGPTIVFSFETEDCNDVAETVISALEHAEQAYRQTDEFSRYVATLKRKAAAVAAARKQKESTLKQKRLTVDDDGNVERNERAVDDDGDASGTEESYEVPEVLPEFTFIPTTRLVEPTVVAKALQACRKLNDKLAVRAIQRGIGIHHAGVKGKVRRQMEILFRGRHCGVVFATETLALGVHSPCRSVVLAGDHVLLNTTQFRQMMGRAGRRGLDYLGHLIFLSISLRKITRLMTSGMTVIKGNVQCDALTQLRLLQLHDYADHRGARDAAPCRARAVAAAERLIVNPLFFAGRAAVEGGNLSPLTVSLFQALLPLFHTAGLHFRDRPSSLGSLLIDVLTVFADVRIGVEGFAFVSMLTRGVFRRAQLHPAVAHLDSGVYAFSRSAIKGPHNVLWRQPCNEAVAELLAYLFSRHRMCGVPLEAHRSVLSDPVVQALWRRGASSQRQHRVVLVPLRLLTANAATAPAIDNTHALLWLSAFYSSMATQLCTAADSRLPYMAARARKKASPFFAKGSTTASTTAATNAAGSLPLAYHLRTSAVPYSARHPLVAISGCGDYFVDTEDLTTTLRSGLYCDRQMLPLLDLTDGCRHDGAQVLLNACVADFARCHAQFNSARSSYRFTLLEELNGMSQSESYAVLNYAERVLSVMAGLTRDKKYEHLQVLESLFPETDDLAAYAGVPSVLNFAHCLKELRSQIDQHQQVAVRKVDNMSERAGAVEHVGPSTTAAAESSDDDDF